MRKNTMNTQTLVKLALMTALSLVLLLLLRFPFPPAPFLVYDPADVPIYISAFAFGPIPGLLVTFVVCFIQAFMLGGDGLYGFLMHFVATGVVAVVIGAVYNRNKTRKTAGRALIIGVILTTAIMCVMNIYVTSAFMGAPKDVVIGMLIPIIIPFNLFKAGVNSILTFILYKSISRFLHNDTRTSR
ncbi:MAG: ECF transporter S component [Clostridiales bacterium]|nr:ECF transporter S component [Candidatus Crickella merdequi]